MIEKDRKVEVTNNANCNARNACTSGANGHANTYAARVIVELSVWNDKYCKAEGRLEQSKETKAQVNENVNATIT